MAIDESIYENIYDIGDPSFVDDQYFDSVFYKSSELCVPNDAIEGIPLFPDFCNGLISMNDSCLLEDFEKNWCVEDQKGNSLNDCNYVDEAVNITKKPRSKRMLKQQHAWSLEDFLVYEKENLRDDMDILLEKEPPRRRCTHCQTDSTPQWRMGPLGPRTLCNACGVRYKSGRLLPEYRPVASPTFDEAKHSNFHKKVLKKRGGIE